jgi:hypothetical protein
MKNTQRKRLGWLSMVLAVMGMLALYGSSGCESGGGSDGSSTIQGNVNRYAGGLAIYMPDHSSSTVLDWVAAIGDLLTTPAYAAGLEGVTVTVDGTSLSAVTDANGNFVITGVPAGTYTLTLTFDGQTASYSVNVPSDNSTVTLSDIEVEHGVVSVANVQIEVEAEDVSGSDSSEDQADDHGGNSGSDDSADDDHSGDSGNSGSGSDNSGSGSDDSGSDHSGSDDDGGDDGK